MNADGSLQPEILVFDPRHATRLSDLTAEDIQAPERRQ